MGRIACIDYGKKRTGLAMTDPLRLIANKLGTVSTGELLPYLKNLVEKEDIDLFVLGQPFRMDGTLSGFEKEILKFIDSLKKTFPEIPIDREDESLTSKLAYSALIHSGVKRKRRRDKTLIDSTAATLILQSYLERTRL